MEYFAIFDRKSGRFITAAKDESCRSKFVSSKFVFFVFQFAHFVSYKYNVTREKKAVR